MDRRSQIINEATRLFSESGFDRITIKQLAEACGITEPALYRHFPSKDAIYDSVLNSIEKRLSAQENFQKLDSQHSFDAFLSEFASHIIEFFSANVDLYRLLLFATLRGHAKAKQVFQVIRGSYVRYLANRLDRFFEEGQIVRKNNEITARCFTGMVFDCVLSTTMWKNYQGRSYQADELIANNVPIYVKGLKK